MHEKDCKSNGDMNINECDCFMSKKAELKILNQLEHPAGTRFLLAHGGWCIHTPKEAAVVAWSGSFTFVKLRIASTENWYNPVALKLIAVEVLN